MGNNNPNLIPPNLKASNFSNSMGNRPNQGQNFSQGINPNNSMQQQNFNMNSFKTFVQQGGQNKQQQHQQQSQQQHQQQQMNFGGININSNQGNQMQNQMGIRNMNNLNNNTSSSNIALFRIPASATNSLYVDG